MLQLSKYSTHSIKPSHSLHRVGLSKSWRELALLENIKSTEMKFEPIGLLTARKSPQDQSVWWNLMIKKATHLCSLKVWTLKQKNFNAFNPPPKIPTKEQVCGANREIKLCNNFWQKSSVQYYLKRNYSDSTCYIPLLSSESHHLPNDLRALLLMLAHRLYIVVILPFCRREWER